ncbi:MAG: hypothetical protein ACT4PP_15660 [Sporichthyaceae bacterium]
MTATRMQVTLDREHHERAAEKASRLGISLAEYVRRLVAADLGAEPEQRADVAEIFGIGRSGGSRVSRHQDEYLAEAIGARRPR